MPFVFCALLAALRPASHAAQDSALQQEHPQLQRRGSPGVSFRDSLDGVLSRAELSPPLHAHLRALRFSPDGSRILLQDESMLYVINRSPLAIQMSFPARLALPARFSADSTLIIAATRDMTVNRVDIAQAQLKDTRRLGAGTDCYAATLSPQGDLYACLGKQSDLQVFRVVSGEEIFTAKTGETPGLASSGRAILPFHVGLPHSEPFGYFLGDFLPPSVERVSSLSNLQFSPDAHYLLCSSFFGGTKAVDLQQLKKIDLASSVKHAVEAGQLEFVAPDRVISVAPTKAEDSALLSFPDGRIVKKLGIAGTASPTSDPRYLVHLTQGAKDAELLDLETLKIVSHISKDGADVFGGDSASYAIDTGLVLARLSESRRILARIPPGGLPLLQTALASPGLETLVVSVSGQGGVFRVSTGAQIATFSGLRGAWFENEHLAYLRVPQPEPLVSHIESFSPETAATEDLWSREDLRVKNESLFSGPILLSHVVRAFYVMIDQQRLGYELRALEIKTGKTLWSRDLGGNGPREGYEGDPPVTFTDPQGDRIVLAWPATYNGARNAAKHSPAAQVQMKEQGKLHDRETVFEILDARTGATLGAAFVPEGSGPQSYSSAFSEGDWLVLVKDNLRITAVSLSTGEQTVHATAMNPALSAESGLLSAAEDGGRVLLYDLQAGAQLKSFNLPEDVVYTRFSADGKRLLALTAFQKVYVLDVTKSVVSPNKN